MSWRIRLEPYLRPLFFAWVRLTRGKTLGVRAVVLDEAGSVLLVRHTYVAGWWLPGGGVEAGQTAGDAMRRELAEEAGLTMTAEPRLISIHSNDRRFRGDHVLLYRVDAGGWTAGERTALGEIAEVGWFAPGELPEGTTAGTQARLAEVLAGAGSGAEW